MAPVWWRRVVFLYELTVLCGLVALAFVYYEVGAVKDLVPELFQGLPVEVAWFGALGGVAISLKGSTTIPLCSRLSHLCLAHFRLAPLV
jgi:hypothetical protein